MTQERRRYGFVLERQCSLAKHWLAYHTAGATAYNTGLDEWLEVSRTREYLPPNVEAMFVSRMRVSIYITGCSFNQSSIKRKLCTLSTYLMTDDLNWLGFVYIGNPPPQITICFVTQ